MEMKEREISLHDLLVEILLHWRIALAAMLIGGIVFGGFDYIQSSSAAKEQRQLLEQQNMSREELVKQWEIRESSLRSRLSDIQVERVYTALTLQRRYAERLDYQQHSMLMRLDPTHIQAAELIFAVQADNADDIYNITDIYEHLLTGVACHAYVKERCGIEGDISEVITLSTPENGALQSGALQGDINGILSSGAFVQKERTNVVCVQILYDDADTCDAMADAVVEFARQQQKELRGTLGGHEIVLLSRSRTESENYEVLTSQNICAIALYSLSDSYTELMKEIKGVELEYYNFLHAGSPADTRDGELRPDKTGQEESAPAPVVAKARVSVKYVLLGIIIFAGIYVFALFIKYILNNKLRSTDSLKELYGIPQFGSVSALSRKRFLGVVDQWILKLRYHNQRRFTPEESVGLAAVAVKMAALKKGAKGVCLLGCELKGNTLEICGQIKEQLEAAGLEVNTLNNILYDAEAMERLGSVGSVVLVETAGVTLYDEILKELELLQRQEIAVLGGIVVEGWY